MSQVDQVNEENGGDGAIRNEEQSSEPKIEPTPEEGQRQSDETCQPEGQTSNEPEGPHDQQKPESKKGDDEHQSAEKIRSEPSDDDDRQSEKERQQSNELDGDNQHQTIVAKSEPTGQSTSEPTTTIESTGEPVVAETQEVSSTRNEDSHKEGQISQQQEHLQQQKHHHQKGGHIHSRQHSMRSSSRRPSYNNSSGGRGVYASGYQNYGLAYLPYKSNFEPSEDAKRRADEFLQTLKL